KLVQQNKCDAELRGTISSQQRVRLEPELEVHGSGPSGFDSMRTIATPVGRGWEYLTGDLRDWRAELDELPALLEEKLAAPSVEAGRYDPGIHPSRSEAR